MAELARAGRSNSEIAEQLGITVPTVKTHMSRVLAKLDLPDRRALAGWDGQPAIPAEPSRRLRLAVPLLPWLRAHREGVALLGRAIGVAAVAVVAAFALFAAIDATRDGRDPPAQAAATPTVAPTTEVTPAPDPPLAVLASGTQEYDYRPQLAFIDDNGDAWLVDADGGNPVLLIEGCGGTPGRKDESVILSGLVWSPDGSRIACVTRDGALLAATADGTERATLLPAGSSCQNVQWSPDGGRIGCTAGSASRWLTIVDPNGAVLAQIPGAGAFTWSPSGQHLVYGTERSPRGGIVDRDGNPVQALDYAPRPPSPELAWTRDGAVMAYANTLGVGVRHFPSWQRRDIDITWSSQFEWNNVPVAWALDDTALLVGGWQNTYLLDPATGTPLPISLPPNLMALAPDGRTALFLDVEPSSAIAGIDLIDLQTGMQTRIGEARFEAMGGGPSFLFSGDSRRLCWIALPLDEYRCSDLDAADPFAVAYTPAKGLPRGWVPFSPDLTRIAYTLPGSDDLTAPQVLWTSALDGSNAVEIGPVTGPHTFTWRPDGVWRPWPDEQGPLLP